MMSKSEKEYQLRSSSGKTAVDKNIKTARKASSMPTDDEQNNIDTLGPGEMFDELVHLDYLEPATDNSQLILPTAYKSVPTVTTIGSSTYSIQDED